VGNFPQSEKSPRGECIDALRSEFWVDLWLTKVTVSMERVRLRLYQVVGSLVARAGSSGMDFVDGRSALAVKCS
jgi:hypothetical protein